MPATGDRQALVLSGLLTGVYFVVELGVGLWSGSIAVISDAFHTFSAVAGVLIALVAQRLSERPGSAEHTFGWRYTTGTCLAAFWPDVVTPPVQGDRFRCHWNGARVDLVERLVGDRAILRLP